MIFTSEIGQNRKLNEQLVKQWVGRDKVGAELKYAPAFDFQPVGKLIFRTNHQPIIKGQDLGIWYRAILIPFNEEFVGDRDDKKLPETLAAEAPGVLNWLLEGCASWRKEGLQIPSRVAEATAAYREEMDELGEFFEEYLLATPSARIRASRIYELYKTWAEEQGGKKVKPSQEFCSMLRDRGYLRKRDKEGRFWIGLGEK